MRKTLSVFLLTSVFTGEARRRDPEIESSSSNISIESTESKEPLMGKWQNRLHYCFAEWVKVKARCVEARDWSKGILLQILPDLGTSIACYYISQGLGIKWSGAMPYEMDFSFPMLGIMFSSYISCYIVLTLLVQFQYFYQEGYQYTFKFLYCVFFTRFWCFLIAKFVSEIDPIFIQLALITLSQFCIIFSQALVGLNVFDRSKDSIKIPNKASEELPWLDRLWVNIFYSDNEEASIYKQGCFLSLVSLIHEIGSWTGAYIAALLLGLDAIKVVPSIQIDIKGGPVLWITLSGITGYFIVFFIFSSLISKNTMNSRWKSIQFRFICFLIDIGYVFLVASVGSVRAAMQPPFNQFFYVINSLIIRCLIIVKLNNSASFIIERFKKDTERLQRELAINQRLQEHGQSILTVGAHIPAAFQRVPEMTARVPATIIGAAASVDVQDRSEAIKALASLTGKNMAKTVDKAIYAFAGQGIKDQIPMPQKKEKEKHEQATSSKQNN